MTLTAYLGIGLVLLPAVGAVSLLTVTYFWLCARYLDVLLRIFVEKPLFNIPRGQRPDDAEDIELTTPEGLKLKAAYLKAHAPKRTGVLFFGLEFGANRWSCVPYVDHLQAAGYDVFTYEPRNQGDSDAQPGYDPLQWVTDRDAADCKLALKYLKGRPDADPRGVGLYGISKGGSAGIAAAADDPAVRCVLTDGAFATYSTMVPYMRYWFQIYNKNYLMHGLVHSWYYGLIAKAALRKTGRERGVEYVDIEDAISRLAPRALFMIHGEKDGYIKPSMSKALYDRAGEPKEFWLVATAKHNQAIEVAAGEYRKKVREFFDAYLASL